MHDNDLTASDLVRQADALRADLAAGLARLADLRAAERERAAQLTAALAVAVDNFRALDAALRAEIAKGATI